MPGRYATLLYLICRLAVGATFIYAALGKWGDAQALARIIDGYGLLPAWAVGPATMILPWLELTTGAALVFGFFEAPAAVILMLLEVVYFIALLSNLSGPDAILAGCFSISESGRTVSWWLVGLNAALIIMTASVLRYAHRRDRSRLRRHA